MESPTDLYWRISEEVDKLARKPFYAKWPSALALDEIVFRLRVLADPDKNGRIEWWEAPHEHLDDLKDNTRHALSRILELILKLDFVDNMTSKQADSIIIRLGECCQRLSDLDCQVRYFRLEDRIASTVDQLQAKFAMSGDGEVDSDASSVISSGQSETSRGVKDESFVASSGVHYVFNFLVQVKQAIATEVRHLVAEQSGRTSDKAELDDNEDQTTSEVHVEQPSQSRAMELSSISIDAAPHSLANHPSTSSQPHGIQEISWAGAPQSTQIRRRRGFRDTAQETLSNYKKETVSLLEKTPAMAFTAAFVTYGGCLNIDLFPSSRNVALVQRSVSNDTVSSIYGPGFVVGWLLLFNTWMYDEYYYEERRVTRYDKSETKVLWDYMRLFLLAGYAGRAVYDQLSLAWKGDFDVTQATARYIVDKAFESAAIMFFISIWRFFTHRRRQLRHKLPVSKDNHQGDPWRYLPALILVSIWGVGRLIEYGKPTYHISPRSPSSSTDSKSLIPYEYRASSWLLGMTLAMMTTRGTLRTRLFEGFCKGFWLAFMILQHSGLFGRLEAIHLTSKSLMDANQAIVLICITLMIGAYYRDDFRGLPRAVLERAKNVFYWTDKV